MIQPDKRSLRHGRQTPCHFLPATSTVVTWPVAWLVTPSSGSLAALLSPLTWWHPALVIRKLKRDWLTGWSCRCRTRRLGLAQSWAKVPMLVQNGPAASNAQDSKSQAFRGCLHGLEVGLQTNWFRFWFPDRAILIWPGFVY